MNTPAIAHCFLRALREGESNGNYRALYGGQTFTSYNGFPIWAGRRVPNPHDPEHPSITHAAGAYQFEPHTWRWVQSYINKHDFTPASQDAGAWWLATDIYDAHHARDLPGDLRIGKWQLIIPTLNSTWTSMTSVWLERLIRAILNPDPVITTQETPQPHPAANPTNRA